MLDVPIRVGGVRAGLARIAAEQVAAAGNDVRYGGFIDVSDEVVLHLPARIELFPEEELTLSLRVWQSGQQLIGEMGDVWSVDDESFRVLDQGFALERRIKAPASGSTTLLVDVLGVQQTLTLEVVP